MIESQIDRFFSTARERFNIKLNRRINRVPWTDDPVFKEWRFCNVHREDDKTTVWFRENVRTHLRGLRLLEATVIFRWFNLISTGEIIKDLLLEGWNKNEARARLKDKKPLVTGAYMIKTLTGENKLDGMLWAIEMAQPILRKILNRWTEDCTIQSMTHELQEVPYLGPFMAYEVASDLRWTHLLTNAKDIMTWANFGPGATHGFGRIINDDSRTLDRHNQDHQVLMVEAMEEILEYSRSDAFWPKTWRHWEAREVEHWLCEFDKYSRAALGMKLKRHFRLEG